MKIRAGALATPESVEQLRRSIAMLAPGTPVWDRDEACQVLEVLGAALRQGPDATKPPPRPRS